MSAIGTKRTSACALHMSAADIRLVFASDPFGGASLTRQNPCLELGMRRREFIKLVARLSRHLAVGSHAQQGDGVRRVAIFMDLSERDAEGQARVSAFRKGLQDLGWTEGRNVKFTFAGPEATPALCGVMRPSL